MNPGITEEASKTAQSTIDALKSTPMVLAIVIFNVLYMGGTFWAIHEAGARWERLIEVAFKYCPAVQVPLQR